MPMNQGGTVSLVPGLTLKARAYFKGNGTIVKSSNIASITKGGAGIYIIAFITAMASAEYVVIARLGVIPSNNSSGTLSAYNFTTNLTTGFTLSTRPSDGVTQADISASIEVYE